MSAGKWMFGGSSKGDLTESPRAKATGNRELPVGYDQGGLNIGDSDASGNSARRKASASAYRASLDADKANMVSDSLPDAKKRTAYDFAPPAAYDADHPLGRSSMNALGEKTVSKMDQQKVAQAEQKRTQLAANRYDIISCMDHETDPINSPRARNAAELLIGKPIAGRSDDGILLIGRTKDQEKDEKKAKQAAYMAQLNADTGKEFGVGENYDPTQDSLNTYKSYERIEQTGVTGLRVSSGASTDMTMSMKELNFDAKRRSQEAYRAVLKEQQAVKAQNAAAEKASDDASTFNGDYFMRPVA